MLLTVFPYGNVVDEHFPLYVVQVPLLREAAAHASFSLHFAKQAVMSLPESDQI
jgi:hypothetical protein